MHSGHWYLFVCTWTCVSVPRRLYIYSVHWPGVEEMSSLTSPAPWGSVHTVPALARMQPKNNQERTMHLPLSFPLLLLHFLAWNDNLQKDHRVITRRKHTILHNRQTVWEEAFLPLCLCNGKKKSEMNNLCIISWQFVSSSVIPIQTKLSSRFTSIIFWHWNDLDVVVFLASLETPISTVIGTLNPCGFVVSLSFYSSILSHAFLFSSCGSQIKASVLFVFECTLGPRSIKCVWRVLSWSGTTGVLLSVLIYTSSLFCRATAQHNSINSGSVDYQFHQIRQG